MPSPDEIPMVGGQVMVTRTVLQQDTTVFKERRGKVDVTVVRLIGRIPADRHLSGDRIIDKDVIPVTVGAQIVPQCGDARSLGKLFHRV